MRVAPVGLAAGLDLDTLAGVAQLQAALTHGHPTALAASELTAYAVRLLRGGRELREVPAALRDRCHDQRTTYREDWLDDLWQQPAVDTPETFISRGSDECLDVLDRLEVALSLTDDGADACRVTGAGWIAEEALATALLCALRRRRGDEAANLITGVITAPVGRGAPREQRRGLRPTGSTAWVAGSTTRA